MALCACVYLGMKLWFRLEVMSLLDLAQLVIGLIHYVGSWAQTHQIDWAFTHHEIGSSLNFNYILKSCVYVFFVVSLNTAFILSIFFIYNFLIRIPIYYSLYHKIYQKI